MLGAEAVCQAMKVTKEWVYVGASTTCAFESLRTENVGVLPFGWKD